VEHAARSAVPVFPLPEVVLFPGIRVPLHVFELRYRTMIRDALSRDRVIALAVLVPGYEADYHGSPAFHPLGCLAHIDEIEWLPDERYDLKVVGTSRVRFGRVEREFPYRAARIEVLPQVPYAEDDPIVQLDKRALLELHGRLGRLAAMQGGESARTSIPVVDHADSYERVVNSLSTVCGRNADERLALLAEDSVIERGRRVRESLERVLGATSLAKPPGAPEDCN
jgi:uncharacterized protein